MHGSKMGNNFTSYTISEPRMIGKGCNCVFRSRQSKSLTSTLSETCLALNLQTIKAVGTTSVISTSAPRIPAEIPALPLPPPNSNILIPVKHGSVPKNWSRPCAARQDAAQNGSSSTVPSRLFDRAFKSSDSGFTTRVHGYSWPAIVVEVCSIGTCC